MRDRPVWEGGFAGIVDRAFLGPQIRTYEYGDKSNEANSSVMLRKYERMAKTRQVVIEGILLMSVGILAADVVKGLFN